MQIFNSGGLYNFSVLFVKDNFLRPLTSKQKAIGFLAMAAIGCLGLGYFLCRIIFTAKKKSPAEVPNQLDIKASIQKAINHFEKNELTEATELFEKAKKDTPKNPTLLKYYGTTLMRQGKFKEALGQ